MAVLKVLQKDMSIIQVTIFVDGVILKVMDMAAYIVRIVNTNMEPETNANGVDQQAMARVAYMVHQILMKDDKDIEK